MRSRLLHSARCLERRIPVWSSPVGRCSGAKWSSTSTRQWSTPLAKTLHEAITTTGPIPVASYMRQCLTSDLGGYYSSDAQQDRDQFGVKGDFVTSPEISQIFGELIGLWFVAEWMAQGQKSKGVYLMEVGPGRGTLMDDMLRTVRNFKAMTSAVEGVYLVEASPALREAQHKLLCGENPLQRTEVGYKSRSKYTEQIEVFWCEDIRLLPTESERTPFIVAHEFFDALPIHIFQSAPPAKQPDSIQTPTGPIDTRRLPKASQTNQWRELLVARTSPYDTQTSMGTPKNLQLDPTPEFQLTVAKASTPHSLYLPEQSQRYRSLKATDHALIEVSPESQTYAADFAVRIGGGNLPFSVPTMDRPPSSTTTSTRRVSRPGTETGTEAALNKSGPSGAALILDYGPASTIPANSLRGIKSHQRVSPFSEPGRVDISADVDFLALAESAINASPGVEVHGPIDQARFLEAMGIRERAAQLVKRALDRERGVGVDGKQNQENVVSEKEERRKEDLTETVKRIESGWQRLVDRGPQGMGKLYQVMAILPHVPAKEGEKVRRPVGFGGDVAV